jgi:hypothetical protein
MIDLKYNSQDWLRGNYYVPVQSSNVLRIRYDEVNQSLWVQYKGTAYKIPQPYYKYTGISPYTALLIFADMSQGKALQPFKQGPFRGPYAEDDGRTSNPPA